MTTRDAMNSFISKCEDTLQLARDQYIDGSRQGHFHDVEYSEAQAQLEERYNELMAMYHSASGEQKERLNRMRLQLQQLQNEMTLLNHH
ncbi:YtzC family protein [Caldibacillus lycopersici]|uniref:YtzC family protein n=1 Tax=Perspicuibacillus lycopersici TaxID=1325689 RepID=A0AAE3IVB8_9BACI|nr:YtzC family protein [Perspicuibacillus lycopersici]MCU9614268.1 YtzC family protein [Perspicuibacillus lycopersici]